EANLAGEPYDPGQQRDGLVDPAVVVCPGVIDEQVIRRPDIREAVLFGKLDGGDDAVAIGVPAEGGEREPVVHGRSVAAPGAAGPGRPSRAPRRLPRPRAPATKP